MVLTQHTPAGRPAWLLPLIVGGIALIGIVVAYFVISSSSDATDASDSNQDDGDVVDVVEQRSEEHTSELQSRGHLVCRLLLEKKNTYLLYGNHFLEYRKKITFTLVT